MQGNFDLFKYEKETIDFRQIVLEMDSTTVECCAVF